MSAKLNDLIRKAAHAHTNLNTFAAVIKVLEGGCLYGPQTEADQIIRLALRAQQRLLREYDRAVAAARAASTPGEQS